MKRKQIYMCDSASLLLIQPPLYQRSLQNNDHLFNYSPTRFTTYLPTHLGFTFFHCRFPRPCFIDKHTFSWIDILCYIVL